MILGLRAPGPDLRSWSSRGWTPSGTRPPLGGIWSTSSPARSRARSARPVRCGIHGL